MSMPPYSQHPGRWGFRVSTLSILILSRPQAFRFQCFLSLDAILNNFAKLFSQVNYLECKMYLNLRFLSTSEEKKGDSMHRHARFNQVVVRLVVVIHRCNAATRVGC